MAGDLWTSARVYDFIRDYIKARGYSPSMKEISAGTGLSSLSSVSYQLKKLEREGKIRRDPAIPRSITVASLRKGEHV